MKLNGQGTILFSYLKWAGAKDIVAEPEGKKCNMFFVRNLSGAFVEVFVYKRTISDYVQLEVRLVLSIRIVELANWGQPSDGSYIEQGGWQWATLELHGVGRAFPEMHRSQYEVLIIIQSCLGKLIATYNSELMISIVFWIWWFYSLRSQI